MADEALRDVDRSALRKIVFTTRALLSESERVAQGFASSHGLSINDFRALLHIVVAENDGAPLMASDVRKRLNVSAGAVTYIIDRLAEAGHVSRQTDSSDRRKVILRYTDQGYRLAKSYFTPMAGHFRDALTSFEDTDLETADRVLGALLDVMRNTPSSQEHSVRKTNGASH